MKRCMRYGFTKPSKPHSSNVRQVQEYNAAPTDPWLLAALRPLRHAQLPKLGCGVMVPQIPRRCSLRVFGLRGEYRCCCCCCYSLVPNRAVLRSWVRIELY